MNQPKLICLLFLIRSRWLYRLFGDRLRVWLCMEMAKDWSNGIRMVLYHLRRSRNCRYSFELLSILSQAPAKLQESNEELQVHFLTPIEGVRQLEINKKMAIHQICLLRCFDSHCWKR